MPTPAITITVVPDDKRLDFLPTHFGPILMVRVEHTIYDVLSNMSTSYGGGLWDFVELSNGGCYMRPQDDKPFAIVSPNGFTGVVSNDAAGIIATMFALSELSFRYPGNERFAERYHQLYELMSQHREVNAIREAID